MAETWWKEGVIYQIYPRSFQDSNGDGIGDLRGIIQRLDYVQQLGVDIIWLNPIFDSPNDDNGYDISDYFSIHPEFGSMNDFKELLDEVHSRGMRLILDVVLNHTSDEHPWFIQSSQPEVNEYSDYYYWRKGKDGGPPNNWPSFFGGSAWEYVPARDAYYLHLFSKKQPDVNWENPGVRKAMEDVLRFWLDMGIDGFRMDVIPLISKRLDFPDADLDNFGKVIEEVYSNGPRVHEYIQGLHRRVLSQYEIFTVGEGPGITQELADLYVSQSRNELDMIFQLDHMAIDHGPGGRFDRQPFDLVRFKKLLRDWDHALAEDSWISPFLDNHDFPRMVSRFGNDRQFRIQSSKLLGMWILTQRGTPSIYFGSEIGMTNVSFPSIEYYRDVEILNMYQILCINGDMSESEYLSLVESQGRDNVRTPMQWDDSFQAGFTSGDPWIPLNPNFESINVKNDLNDSASVYKFYQRMLHIRKKYKTLVYGQFELLFEDHPKIYAYTRTNTEESFLILLNFSDESTPVPINLQGHLLELGNYPGADSDELQPWEARLYRRH